MSESFKGMCGWAMLGVAILLSLGCVSRTVAPKPYPIPKASKASDTFVLAPVAGRWVDITGQVLPKEVAREWAFQPRASSARIQAGPYQAVGEGRWTQGKCVADLVWLDDGFHLQAPESSEFSLY